MTYSVSEVAGMAGVTVRTLHHYDDIGLLQPSGRTQAGYRQYDDADVDRLREILFYRELGLSLDDIATVLEDPATDPGQHLLRQRSLLSDRIARLEALVAAIDRSLEANRMGYQLSAQEKLEIFGHWEPPPSYWTELAQFRSRPKEFGSTESWPVPETKADWQAMEDHRRDVAQRMAAAIEAGIRPDSAEAMDLAEAARGAKSHTQQVLIADWYAAKPEYFGFIARPHEQVPGMATWFRDAARANATRANAADQT